MKRRLTPILAIGIMVLLIGSLAYAADRKKRTKLVERTPDTITEEEALKAELLDALEDQQKISKDTADPAGVTSAKTTEKRAQLKSGR